MPDRKCVSHKVLVGLEIHVQLSTKTKMFTGVANASGALKVGQAPPEPNTAVDEQILGLPGTLPVMNKKAVESSIKVGLALGCKIAKFTKWDRKSYYYPDLPKNYQISQYDLPLCYEGLFEMAGADGQPKSVRIRRAHLEEDAGKLLHDAPGGYHIDYSIVDLNRAGTPLLEVVTEPDLSDPKDVSNFGQELQKLVQHLGVSEGQMQLGHMRFEPNINVHITDADGKVHKTAITEIKNLNSFSVLEKAVAYEVQRQIREWEETGTLGKKATHGWNDDKQETFLQREKEEAHDYRYFPDPDLMPVEVSEEWLTELKGQIGESPTERRLRYASSLNPADASAMAGDKKLGDYFDEVVILGANPKRAANLIINTLAQISNLKKKAIYDLDIPPGRGARRGRADRREQDRRQQRLAPVRQARRSRYRDGRQHGRSGHAPWLDPKQRHRPDRRRHRRDDRPESQAPAGIPRRQGGRAWRPHRHGHEAGPRVQREAGAGTAQRKTSVKLGHGGSGRFTFIGFRSPSGVRTAVRIVGRLGDAVGVVCGRGVCHRHAAYSVHIGGDRSRERSAPCGHWRCADGRRGR